MVVPCENSPTAPVREISLADLRAASPDGRAEVTQTLFDGLRETGFIILRDHGIAPDALENAYRMARAFFALSAPEKLRYDSGVGGQRGYTAFGREHAKGNVLPDLKEFWHVGREFPDHHPLAELYPPNKWPDQPAGLRDAFLTLYDRLEGAGLDLLDALAPALDLPADSFRMMATNGNSILRVLHYPPVPDGAPPGAVRAAAHEDINLITILVSADGAGLELLSRDGEWLAVETDPANLIVDAGDMLARMTNDLIPATTHRVVNPSGPNVSRYSMPFFLHPVSDADLSCIPSCLGDGAKYPPITAGAFLAQRLREIGL